jgi:hypothetical protein
VALRAIPAAFVLVLTVTLAAAAATVPVAVAAGPRVSVMVVGRTRVLQEPRTVSASRFTAPVGHKRCGVAPGTPLAALAGLRRTGGPGYSLVDMGSCSKRTVDSGALFVTRIGPDANRGRDGWVYKVGRRAGTAGAADATGPFGSGPLSAGAQVTWFWCVLSATSLCQRTLEATPVAPAVAPGAPLRVLVRGFDDGGHGVRIAGATVRLGATSATTGADGFATVTAPARAGTAALVAQRTGLVRSFPAEVRVR